MAIDQQNKRRGLAREVMTQVDIFMAALYAARDAVNESASSGLTYVADDFETSTDMKHITTTNLATAYSNVTTLVSILEAGGTAAASVDDVFNLIRP